MSPSRAHVVTAATVCKLSQQQINKSTLAAASLIMARPILIANGLTAHIGNWRAFVKQKEPPGHANTSLLIC
jgi:hypothetical protein